MQHKKLISLDLNLRRTTWRTASAGQVTDPAIKNTHQRVIERDDFTCRGCNFRSPPTKTKSGDGPSFMEVHHLDHDHGNNKASNLATLCPMCHQVFHIGHAGENQSASLIWLPEISQADLNNFVRAIFISIVAESDPRLIADNPQAAAILERAEELAEKEESLEDGEGFNKQAYIQDQVRLLEPALPIAGSARSAYAALEARALYLEEVFSERASDPVFFGQAILDVAEKSINPELLKGVRVLARPDRMGNQIQHWLKHAYKGLPISSWPGLVKAITE
ncbi:hypothetical protein ACKF11_13480 [Methylobacillus sp. Pita2]|uniref:hypothetical protein n=1 Tax=Methylobacillus sp. Pita2 TaxID=3383245 RepID=UPI0038B5E562